ncbi:MAG: nucleoside-diphosphate kinase [Candidatus Eisenbacteria bacterium]|nr:nucleoside-diphosphate kinase [Candidatus Eisenbacteria bacterium]
MCIRDRIKPDAVRRNLIGEILSRVEEAGLGLRRLRMVALSESQAREFYKVHEGKPFLDSLVAFMASGPIVAAVVEGEDAIRRLADVVGATDPKKAAPGTIRADFGLNIEQNSVHRSDAPETAAAEIAFFGLDLSLR